MFNHVENGLVKDLINIFSVFNREKHFSSGIFENYLIFIPAKNYIKNCINNTWIDS